MHTQSHTMGLFLRDFMSDGCAMQNIILLNNVGPQNTIMIHWEFSVNLTVHV